MSSLVKHFGKATKYVALEAVFIFEHVEAEIIVAVEQEIEEKGNAYMRYSSLLHKVRIPYRMYGFNRPLDFVKSIKKLRVEEGPNQFPRLYLCENVEPQVKRPGFDDDVMEFVYNFLRTHPNYDYVPYNTLVHALTVPKHELEAVGYKRLLDYMKEHDKFRVTQHPDARLWLVTLMIIFFRPKKYSNC